MRRTFFVAMVAGMQVLILAGAASAAPPTIVEFQVPTLGSQPWDIATGSDGNLWFTEHGASAIGRITPAGVFSEFPLDGERPIAITSGPDGNVWFTTENTGPACSDTVPTYQVGRITPAGSITKFPLPGNCADGSGPQDLVAGPDGNLWVTENQNARIAVVTPSGTVTEYLNPGDQGPGGVTVGPDGAIWYTNVPYRNGGANAIGRMTTTGSGSHFGGLSYDAQPRNLTVGPDNNFWITEKNSSQIATMTVGGVVTQHNVAVDSFPQDIVVGSDDHLWFTEAAGSIGRMGTDGSLAEYPVPTSSATPLRLTSGPDGNIWFTEQSANKIGMLAVDSVPVPEGVDVGLEVALVGMSAAGWWAWRRRRSVGLV